MNEPGVMMAPEKSCNVAVDRVGGFMSSRVGLPENDVGTQLSRHQPLEGGLGGGCVAVPLKVPADVKSNHHGEHADALYCGSKLHSITSVADLSVHSSSDASHMTSATVELRKAAKKTISHANSKRAADAAVPLELKEALLLKAFPHIRAAHHGNGEDDADSTAAERSSFEQERSGVMKTGIDYGDCIKTLSEDEMLHLRSAMYGYEEQRAKSMMNNLSNQMKAWHQLAEEKQSLEQELSRVTKEKDDMISELERSVIDMKLQLAQLQSQDDHHRLRINELEMNLKNARDENPRGDPTADRRTSVPPRRLTRSMSSAESPGTNVRAAILQPINKPGAEKSDMNIRALVQPIKEDPSGKKSPLTRSWFGKEGLSFLDRSFRREDKAEIGASTHASPAQAQDTSAKNDTSPRRPATHKRTRSLVVPKKAQVAPKESSFMPWGLMMPARAEAKDEPQNPRLIKSQSFVDPKKARAMSEAILGTDVVFTRQEDTDNDGFDSRSTILSNITCPFDVDGDSAAGGDSFGELLKKTLHAKQQSDDGKLSCIASASGGSLATLEFEPAKPQLQKSLSLRDAGAEPDLQATGINLRGTDREHPLLRKTASPSRKVGGAGGANLAYC